MKSIVNLAFILSGALLVSMPAFAQVKTDHSLNKSKMEVKMETNKSVDSNKAIIRKLYEEILNTGKLELLSQVVSDEYTGPRGMKGPAGFAEAIKPIILAFPDIKWTIEDIIAEGDKVMVRWSWTGTNKGSFDGFPPTNKVVNHNAINIFLFSGDKIIKAWMQSDRLGFYQQIGVISLDAVKPLVKN
ncbi:MAG: hypothetical protein JWQ63_11 [Mucilaginibacter sp.]|nr:hypothetical protein [Mucilaginibacter sp.]